MLKRYDRQLVLKEVGIEGQKKLLSSKVLVIGAGGLGSSTLMYLAAAGVGEIGIADYDKVDITNLQRQILHKTSSEGKLKAQSASEALALLNPDVKINLFTDKVTESNIDALIKPYDFVLDCVDRFQTKFLINDACVRGKKPYSHAGVVRFEGQAMTYVPGSPCLRCLLGSPPNDVTCAEVGVLGAVVGTLGCIQATEAIKYLLGIGKLLTGKVLLFDGLNMNIKVVSFPNISPDCPVCN